VIQVLLHLLIHHRVITPVLLHHPLHAHLHHHLVLLTQVIAVRHPHLVEIQAAVLMTANATASVIPN
jgi:hypothetical protein